MLYFFRRFKIPIYKSIYDGLNMHSYYVVLERLLEFKKGGIYFEWGPGLNTDMAIQKMSKVFSVENNEYWHSVYKRTNALILSPISEQSCLDYPEEIKKIQERVDLALVDGRCRVQCVKACAENGVPIVIMHDSLRPDNFERASDEAPPVGNKGIFYTAGFINYDFFVEVVDLRTIVLIKEQSDYEKIKAMFEDYKIRFGRSVDY